MKTNPTSVKWKIFLFMLFFSILMIIILWVFQTVFLEAFYKQIKQSSVERETKALVVYLEADKMDAFDASVQGRGDLYVELVDEDGNTLVAQNSFPEVRPTLLQPDEKREIYAEAKENGVMVLIRREKNNSGPGFDRGGQNVIQADGMQRPDDGGGGNRRAQEVLMCAQIVTLSDGEECMLLVSADLTPVSATVETLRVQLIWISVIMLVLAVVLALLMSRSVSKPIVKLNVSAQELGRGNYDAVFEGGGYREVEELSDTLNHAAVELSKTEALRRELIANVSHDLRTPLTLITGYAEMMRDIPGEDSAENVQVIIDEAQRLSVLVGDLLDLSRVQSGTQEMNPEVFDLKQETADIVARFSKLAEPEGFRVSFEEDVPVHVYADAPRIGRVIYNFLVNAMLYCGEDKEIIVRQVSAGDWVRVEVEDHGEGISKEELPYIWERYYKVDEVHKRPVTGTGLGLSIVKKILEQHPGVEYGVDSEKGAGSRFWFSLPVASFGDEEPG